MPDLQDQNYVGTGRFSGTREAAPERPQAAPEAEEKRSMEVVAGGSVLESLAGAGVVVLAIIALSVTGALVMYLTAISVIVAGGGLILHGTSLAARIKDLVSETADSGGEQADLGTGMTVEVLAGAAGITLGILALIGFVPGILMPISVLVFGTALLLASGTVTELNDLRLARARVSASARQITRSATVGAAGIQALTGVAAITLGILGIVGFVPTTLTLVALLCIGGGMLLTGGALTGRMLTFLARV